MNKNLSKEKTYRIRMITWGWAEVDKKHEGISCPMTTETIHFGILDQKGYV